MEAGKLRQRVTIQQEIPDIGGLDDYGQPVPPWEDVATVWAAVEPLQGREYFAAQQIAAEVTTRITMRYREGMNPQMRIAYGDITYEILAVINPAERGRELQILCRELVGATPAM